MFATCRRRGFGAPPGMPFRYRVLLLLLAGAFPALALTEAELESIGHRVWQNECGGTREGLTSWNAGENFASLGIGHFIWYPRRRRAARLRRAFRKLLRFLEAQGVPSRRV